MRIIVMFGLLSLLAVTYAGLDPDPQLAEAAVANRNVALFGNISCARRVVSGTCVEIPVFADYDLEPLASDDDWTGARFSHATLTIGGEPVQMPGLEPGMKAYFRAVRFASNHFAHASALPVRIQAWFILTRQTSSGPVQVSASPGVIEFQLTAYNSAFVDGTGAYSNGASLLPLTPAYEPLVIELDAAHDAFAACKYPRQPGRVNAQTVTKEDLLGATRSHTALYAGTHGDPAGVFDSLPPTPPPITGFRKPEDFVTLDEFGAVVQQKGALPLYDFVALYSCSTAASAHLVMNHFFGGTSQEHVATRMLFGFQSDVYSLAFSKVTAGASFLDLIKDASNVRFLGDQAATLLEALRKGPQPAKLTPLQRRR